MNFSIDLVSQVANSFFTMFCGVIILYFVSKGRLERHSFYYGWSVAFVLYGVQILMRMFLPYDYLIAIPMILSSVILPVSTWSLSKRRDVLPVLMFFLVVSALIITALAMVRSAFVWFSAASWTLGSFFVYLPVTVIIVIHRTLFGNCVDKLIIGWGLLFLLNVLMPMGGWILDIMSIISKGVILLGILSYDFALVTEKVRTGLVAPELSFTKGSEEEGGLKLVMFKSRDEPSMNALSKLVGNTVEENIKRSIETSILVLQDVVPYSVLRSFAWRKPELIHVFIFSKNPMSNSEFPNLRYGETELGATITEIARKAMGSKTRTEIILIDLSIMVHTFGAHESYNFLLNKMGILRSSGTSLVAIFHPQTHEEAVASLFRTMADNIIQV